MGHDATFARLLKKKEVVCRRITGNHDAISDEGGMQ